MSDSCDPMDCSPPGSFVHGILQARILEWVAISFSRGSSQPRNWTQVSCIADRCFTDLAMKEAQVVINWTIIVKQYFLSRPSDSQEERNRMMKEWKWSESWSLDWSDGFNTSKKYFPIESLALLDVPSHYESYIYPS